MIDALNPCFTFPGWMDRAYRSTDRFLYFTVRHSIRSGPNECDHLVGKNRSGLVARLLFFCRPAAISRLIISVIVDAINAVSRPRLWPHVRVEVRKAVVPSIADFYAAPTVYRVFCAGRRIAAIFHVRPRPVFTGAFLPARNHPVFGSGRSDQRALHAPATAHVALPEVYGLDDLGFAAIADAVPCGRTTNGFGEADNHKVAISIAGEVHYPVHAGIIRLLRANVNWERKSNRGDK